MLANIEDSKALMELFVGAIISISFTQKIYIYLITRPPLNINVKCLKHNLQSKNVYVSKWDEEKYEQMFYRGQTQKPNTFSLQISTIRSKLALYRFAAVRNVLIPDDCLIAFLANGNLNN